MMRWGRGRRQILIAVSPPPFLIFYAITSRLRLRRIIKVIGCCFDDLYIPYPCKGAVCREEYPACYKRVHNVHGFSQLNIRPRLGNRWFS